MVVKSLVDSRLHFCPGNLEGHEKPDEGEVLKEFTKESESEPYKVVDDLYSTEDGEASKKAHGASYQTQLGFHCHLQINAYKHTVPSKTEIDPEQYLLIPLDLIICSRVKVDVHCLQWGMFQYLG